MQLGQNFLLLFTNRSIVVLCRVQSVCCPCQVPAWGTDVFFFFFSPGCQTLLSPEPFWIANMYLVHVSVFKPEELRQALMPTLESLYRQDPESLPFRQPVDPMLLGIPVRSTHALTTLCFYFKYNL